MDGSSERGTKWFVIPSIGDVVGKPKLYYVDRQLETFKLHMWQA